MAKKSAGLLLYRRRGTSVEVFLVHPGGPFWARKDLAAWTMPKGEFSDEEPLAAALREFNEETGFDINQLKGGDFLELGITKQAGGKSVFAWAVEGDCDPALLVSNLCEIEWPPRSGRKMEIPEADRGAWFPIEDAVQRILQGQAVFLQRLSEKLGIGA
jgi:predicted NUDIX family NTP pyrophosphohydrolase